LSISLKENPGVDGLGIDWADAESIITIAKIITRSNDKLLLILPMRTVGCGLRYKGSRKAFLTGLSQGLRLCDNSIGYQKIADLLTKSNGWSSVF
jgi:hypothetical protein